MKIRKIMLVRSGVRIPWGNFTQPLGLLYLVSVLRREFPGQFEIDLVEQALYNLTAREMRQRIAAFKPDVIGFSCISLEAEDMAEVAAAAKEFNPQCLVILGGPHAKFFYDHALENPAIDIAVIGEGERTFPELLRKLIAAQPLDDVNGIAYKKDGRVVLAAAREPIEELDSLPLPAWDLVDFTRYNKVASMNGYCHSKPWAVILTSRGCPFHCAYCHDIFGKKARLRSPENVLAEIELLTGTYGVKEIHIVDDIFNIDLARAKRICDLIVERNIKITIAFPNALRIDIMDRELLQKLKMAGCYVVTYAIETASPRIQKLLGKNVDLDKALQVIKWTHEENIITHGFFMIGFPGETRAEMALTGKWALESELWLPIFFMAVVYPRTRLLEIARATYPAFDFSKWEMRDLQYRMGESFYEKATGVELSRIHLDMVRRGYFKFAKKILTSMPFPGNMVFLLSFIWWALPRGSVIVRKIESFMYPGPQQSPRG
ncbi:MAG: hypothetical protein A2234_08920 [Elusimicrobia bacterium RIFOXYA2_FULL_58_8]|nr:MAG: hypothetical protein A2285_03205 [Elusimicrobia bacterium RIFOXYA12_FULL_57_11]OGS15085.1 MAG: hypothetical protein A2234_08920 [Elusimicrobia bacterium RIFOXYA2_FULL_58_8]